jgi:hypothetical protein
MATHRLQDGFGLARFRFDAESKRVVRVENEAKVSSRGERDEPITRFMVYRDGRVYFEGAPEELAESKDSYLQRFLV